MLTKQLDKGKVKQLPATLALWAEPGRAASAPQLAAEVEAFLALVRGGASCAGTVCPAPAGEHRPPGLSPSSRACEPVMCEMRHE